MEVLENPTDDKSTQFLKDLVAGEPNSIKASVAQQALDYHDISDFFTDIMQHGCKSGMITSLIYYSDTHAFFDKHYDVIEKIRDEVENNLGEPLVVDGDLKNSLAWFAFEETAYQMALNLGLLK